MQLREVGKLAMYLRKMWWLQRLSHWAQLWAVSCSCGRLARGSTIGFSIVLLLHCCLAVGGVVLLGGAHLSVYQVAHMELLLCKGI